MQFTLVDRIIKLKPGESIKAVKNLTIAEEYLADHFPNFPVMPGVLMLESMTQASAWLIRVTDDFAHSMVVLREVNNIKYGQFLEPGQQMTVMSEIAKWEEGAVKVKAQGVVGDRMTVSARLTLACYNLADTNPDYAGLDEANIQRFKKQFKILYPEGATEE